MEAIIFLEIILLFLCILGCCAVVVFFMRKNRKELDVDKLIKQFNNQKESDLEKLKQGNKQIDDIERKILICKKKLNMKLFDKI